MSQVGVCAERRFRRTALFVASMLAIGLLKAQPPGREWIHDGIVASSDMASLTFILRRGAEARTRSNDGVASAAKLPSES